MAISTSLEEYLHIIYQLDKENLGVRVTDIAQELRVQKSSTNKALNLLKEEELVNYEKYRNVTLTINGVAMAKHIEKRNTLLKKFLTDILGVEEKLANTEAEKLAHCISCHTTAKLERYIEDIFEQCQNKNCILKKKGREKNGENKIF